MLHFFSFDEKSLVHMHYAAMRQSVRIPFFVWFLRFLHTHILHKLTRQKRGEGGGGGQFKGHFPYLMVRAALNFHLYGGIQIEKITKQFTCSFVYVCVEGAWH